MPLACHVKRRRVLMTGTRSGQVNGVKCNFLIDSGASENILSLSASKVCNVNLKSCDTRVYVYNSSDPFHVLGNFWA